MSYSTQPVLIRQWLHRLKLPDIRGRREVLIRLAPRLELLVYPGFHAAPFDLPIVSA
jgi:hypothetical protein